MRWDARGTIALLASALVGVTAGAIVGVSSGTGGPGAAEPGGPSSPSTSGAPDDPLGLGIPLVNIQCDGKKILVVGFGEAADSGELSNAVSANDGAKYLETSKSCNTVYGDEDQVPPTYVVYLGPFDTIKDPCAEQMTPTHARDAVTNLKPGIKVHVQCLCVLAPATFPRLKPGMHATTRDGIYIRALQQLMADIDLLPQSRVTGQYNAKTAQRIGEFQTLNAITPKTPESVDVQTWLAVRDRGCVTYDF